LCQACGACCAYAPDWPRFTTETAEELAALPHHLVNDEESGMRWDGDRCAALAGEVGRATRCGVYADRPDVCRACMPGDEACLMARARHGLPPVVGFS
jgi:Fe-S-cluster containining protein